jgi:hypothetical protein
MEHYFSHRLVSYFWFKDEEAATKLGTLKYNSRGVIRTTLIDFEDYKKYKLLNRQYLTIPQLLAVDFYLVARKAGIIGYHTKRRHILSACGKLLELPKAGWDVSKFKIKILSPYRCADVFIAYGTSFELAPMVPRIARLHHIFAYRGSDFMATLKKCLKNIWVYGQVTPIGVFWGIRTLVQRMGWMKCRPVGGEIDKRKLFSSI